MMRFRTNFEGNKLHDELYECKDCGKQYESYNALHHPDEHTGGYCWCGSDDIKVLIYKTIYQELWVEDTASVDDVLEVALELETWEVADHAIRINGEQK